MHVHCFRFLFAYNRLAMSRFDRPVHRVYCTFFCRNGWQVQFTEADLKTPLPRRLTFASPEKIRALARKGEAMADAESRQLLEAAIAVGRGGFFLKLNHEQYKKLSSGETAAPSALRLHDKG